MEINNTDIPVETLREQWAMALMTEGVIVRLRISKWSAMATLKPHDFGIKFSDKEARECCKKYISWGRERLLPPEVMRDLNSLSSMAHTNLREHSYDTPWGKFVPFSAFNNWYRINEECRQRYEDAIARLIERYDDIITILRQDYRSLARDVWTRLYPNDQGGPTESFTENFISRIVAKVPPPESLVEKFGYYTTYLAIPLPSFIERDVAKIEEIQHESELQQETRRLIEEEYRQKKKDLIDSFLQTTVVAIRSHLSELCDELITSISQNQGNIRHNHVKRINKMIEQVSLLNFHNDKKIQNILNDLRREIFKYKGDRNDNFVVQKLTQLVEVASDELCPSNINPMTDFLDID